MRGALNCITSSDSDMLGKRSHPLLGTSSKTSFPRVLDYHKKAVFRQTSSKHSLLPQHMTVGFEIPQDRSGKPSDACESPRSVLEVNVPSEKNLCGRAFRSYVQALPFRKDGGQGVGLAILVDIHAEEKGCVYDSLPCAARVSAPVGVLNASYLSSERLDAHDQRSQPIPIAPKCHSRHRSCTCSSTRNAEYSRVGMKDDGDDGDDSSCFGSVESLDSDCLLSWCQNVAPNESGMKADHDVSDYRPSIFAVASVGSDDGSYGIQSICALEACALCQRDFAPGKDIFMYRGDQAFCSTECRSERINMDEYKERLTITTYL